MGVVVVCFLEIWKGTSGLIALPGLFLGGLRLAMLWGPGPRRSKGLHCLCWASVCARNDLSPPGSRAVPVPLHRDREGQVASAPLRGRVSGCVGQGWGSGPVGGPRIWRLPVPASLEGEEYFAFAKALLSVSQEDSGH